MTESCLCCLWPFGDVPGDVPVGEGSFVLGSNASPTSGMVYGFGGGRGVFAPLRSLTYGDMGWRLRSVRAGIPDVADRRGESAENEPSCRGERAWNQLLTYVIELMAITLPQYHRPGRARAIWTNPQPFPSPFSSAHACVSLPCDRYGSSCSIYLGLSWQRQARLSEFCRLCI